MQKTNIKTIRSVIFVLAGIAFAFYSIYQSLMPGYNFFPTIWGAFQGHKDIGGIYFFALGVALLDRGLFDPNAKWNLPKREKV